MREVLVIRFGALGDLALATVLLEALRAEDGPMHITWVTRRRWAGLLEGDPRIDELVVLEEGESIRALARRLAPRYDLVLDAHGNLRSRLLCLHVRGRQVRRLEKDTVARWLYRHGAPRGRVLERRLVDRFLALVEREPGSFRPVLRSGPGATVPRSGIAVAVGAAHEAKLWPVDRFRDLVETLQSGMDPVLVLGGPGEEALVDEAIGSSGAMRWDHRRPLGELCDALAGCRVLVGNDSGLLHVAEACGTPVVGLFGPTVRAWGYFPWREESRVFEHELDCRPCSKMGEKPCRLPEKLCLTMTGVDPVRAAIEEILHGDD